MNILKQVVDCLQAKGPDRQGWYTALCPFHLDKLHPNLRFRGTGFRCMACGQRGSLRMLAVELGIAAEMQPNRMANRIVATYDYKDENGTLLFEVVRFQPKTFRQRRPDGNNHWTWNLQGVRRVLYRLPDLLESPKQALVFVVEGEKDVDSLRSLGLVATCNPGGAGKFTAELRGPLKERRVVVIADKDDAGRRHAEQVAALLHQFAADAKVMELPGDQVKDAADWIAAGGTREQLLDLADATVSRQAENGADVLDSIVDFLRRFVVLSQNQAEAIALWVVHTHAFQAAEATPYLSIKSAEKRSGKTRLLETLELLVARPWLTGRVTYAVLARKVDVECPTLLLDESDAAFRGQKEYAETLRAILNTGYRRGGKTSICVGQGANLSYKDLSTFCPKAIAGIGNLPDTVADRSIPIVLKRRAPGEQIERFRRRRIEVEASTVRGRVIRWAGELSSSDTEPQIPQELDDRSSDCWEPLLAIADIAGGDWPEKGRKAAVNLMTGAARQDESLGMRLLADIHSVFENRDNQTSSEDLVGALKAMSDGPWVDFNGKPLTQRRLASMLRPYDIRPHTIRVGNDTPKGYRQEDFKDAWDRYLPRSTAQSATSATADSTQIHENTPEDPQQACSEMHNVADVFQRHLTPNVADETPVSDNVTRWEVEI